MVCLFVNDGFRGRANKCENKVFIHLF